MKNGHFIRWLLLYFDKEKDMISNVEYLCELCLTNKLLVCFLSPNALKGFSVFILELYDFLSIASFSI